MCWTVLVSITEVLDELVRRAERNESSWHVSSDDMAWWMVTTHLSEAAVLDGVALQLAREYDRDALTFEIADDVANALHAYVTLEGASRPELFDSVFSAFDEGEYHHDGDQTDDPELVFTRPQIKEILAGSQRETS